MAVDQRQFETIFRTTAPALWHFVYRYVRCPDAADDLVHDVFLALWTREDLWAGDRPIKPYLYRAARNHALDHLKHRRVVERSRTLPCPEVGHGTHDESLLARELAEVVQRAVEDMPAPIRETFLLTRANALTYTEVAKRMQVSTKTVEARITRALRVLRRHVAHWRTC